MHESNPTRPLTWTDTPLKTRTRSQGLTLNRSQGLTLAQSKAAMLADSSDNPLVPTIATTLMISLFFGVFGVIPASIHADRARRQGAPTAKYWQTFLTVMALDLLLMVLVIR